MKRLQVCKKKHQLEQAARFGGSFVGYIDFAAFRKHRSCCEINGRSGAVRHKREGQGVPAFPQDMGPPNGRKYIGVLPNLPWSYGPLAVIGFWAHFALVFQKDIDVTVMW